MISDILVTTVKDGNENLSDITQYTFISHSKCNAVDVYDWCVGHSSHDLASESS